MTDTLDVMDYFYTQGGDRPGDKAGLRAVGNMTEEEAKQALCRMIRFGFWHEAHQVSCGGAQLLREAAAQQLGGKVH